MRSAANDDLVDSETRTIAAGTGGIEIVLQRGSGVSVRVLDARGNPVADAVVWILCDRKYGNRTHTGASGVARFDNVPAGTFSLSASTAAGDFALARGVTLTAGSALREVELRLVPSSRLRVEVQHGPETRMQAMIFLEGGPIALMFLDESPVTALAPGEYEVALWGEGEKEVQRQRVRVATEGETRVVFDLGAPR